jgi:hypothetical protein
VAGRARSEKYGVFGRRDHRETSREGRLPRRVKPVDGARASSCSPASKSTGAKFPCPRVESAAKKIRHPIPHVAPIEIGLAPTATRASRSRRNATDPNVEPCRQLPLQRTSRARRGRQVDRLRSRLREGPGGLSTGNQDPSPLSARPRTMWPLSRAARTASAPVPCEAPTTRMFTRSVLPGNQRARRCGVRDPVPRTTR